MNRVLTLALVQGVVIATTTLVLVYLFLELQPLVATRDKLQHEVEVSKNLLTSVRGDLEQTREQLTSATQRMTELESTQASILGFLERVAKRQDLRLFDSEVNWEKTKARLMTLPPGRRKDAVFGALLLAWKEIPFKLGGASVKSGIDSTKFMLLVLDLAGVGVPPDPKRRPSEVMMSFFERTTRPEPGDLMFFKGEVGNFVLMYLDDGQEGGNGVGIGTFETGTEVQVMDSKKINTPVYPFLGYWRVKY